MAFHTPFVIASGSASSCRCTQSTQSFRASLLALLRKCFAWGSSCAYAAVASSSACRVASVIQAFLALAWKTLRAALCMAVTKWSGLRESGASRCGRAGGRSVLPPDRVRVFLPNSANVSAFSFPSCPECPTSCLWRCGLHLPVRTLMDQRLSV